MGYGNIITRDMIPYVNKAVEYSYCGHEECDLGVNGDGKIMCSGNHCADHSGWDPPTDAYWGSEEDYPR